MTKLGTAILLIVSAAISHGGCDSNPTPHPIHGEPDATGPNIGGGDVLGTELGRDPEAGNQDPDDNECPCATPGPDNEYGSEDDTDSGRGEDDNETDPCDDDNGTAPADPEDSDGDLPEPPEPPGTVRKKLP